MTVKVFKDDAGEWRWRKERTGNIIATSGEGYKNKEWAEHMAQQEADEGETVEVEGE